MGLGLHLDPLQHRQVKLTITSWDVLFDPAYAGHISMWDDGPGAVTVSSYIHGWDETRSPTDQLAQIEEEWNAQKPLNTTYWTERVRRTSARRCRAGTSGSPTPGRAATPRSCTTASQPVAYANPRRGATRGSACTASAPRPATTSSRSSSWTTSSATLSCSNAVTQFYYGCANQDVMDGRSTDPVLIKAFGLDDPAILRAHQLHAAVTRRSGRRGPRCGRASRPRPSRARALTDARTARKPAVPRRPAVRVADPALRRSPPAGVAHQLPGRVADRSTSAAPGSSRPSSTRRSSTRRSGCGCWASRPAWLHRRRGRHPARLPDRLLPGVPGARAGRGSSWSCCSFRPRPASCCG